MFYEFVFVALCMQHAMRVRRITLVIRGLHASTSFSHFISQKATFSKNSYWTQNVCFDFLYNFCVKHF